jgi:site-specific DNA recombinase
LITPELFDRVQDSHSGAGVRSRKYNHYLKGVFWCARCGSRTIFQRANGKGGTYYYFACGGMRRHTCDQPYMLAEELEQALLQYYVGVCLTDDFHQRVARRVDKTLLDEQGVQTRIRTRLKELSKHEDRYMELIGDPEWPQDKLKGKVAEKRRERVSITRELEEIGCSLDAGRQLLHKAIVLLHSEAAGH